MVWNELKTKGEQLAFCDGAIENLTGSHAYTERHRTKMREAGFTVREMINPGRKPKEFTKVPGFMEKTYKRRVIDPEILTIRQQIVIYNDTVSIYNWHDNRKVGLEIINPAFANTYRSIFEHFWKLAK
jgi:hypothetical protein